MTNAWFARQADLKTGAVVSPHQNGAKLPNANEGFVYDR
jgi:hypothetical protein